MTSVDSPSECLALIAILNKLNGDPKRRVDEVHKRAKQQKKPGRLTGVDAWYQASYDVFKASGRPRNRADFIRIIAYAYSWLPRNNPAACPTDEEFRELANAVQAATDAYTTGASASELKAARKKLIGRAQTAVGVEGPDSIVTVSKVLHFWDPKLAPMIDRHVARALNHLPGQLLKTVALKTDPYLDYWAFADRLIAASKAHPITELSYRKLDELLFQLGRAVAPPRAKPARTPRTTTDAARPNKRSNPTSTRQTKDEIARRIYGEMRGMPAKDVQKALVERARLTTKGASSYYYRIKGEDAQEE